MKSKKLENPERSKGFTSKKIVDFLIPVFIAALSLSWFSIIRDFVLDYSDELHIYMSLAKGRDSIADYNLAWGPLYGIWYWILGFIGDSPMMIYDLNTFILGVLTAVLVYIFYLKFNDSKILATLASLLFILNPIFYTLENRVSLFLVTINISGLLLIHKINPKNKKGYLVSALMLISGYVRPECFPIGILLILLLTIIDLFRKIYSKPPFIILGLLAVLFIFDMTPMQGKSTWILTAKITEWYVESGQVSDFSSAVLLFEDKFNTNNYRIYNLLYVNFSELMRFFLWNLKYHLKMILDLLTSYELNFSSPATIVLSLLIFLILMNGALGKAKFLKLNYSDSRICSEARKNLLLWFCFVLIVPIFISGMIFGVKDRQMIPYLAVFSILFPLLFSRLKVARDSKYTLIAILAFGVLILSTSAKNKLSSQLNPYQALKRKTAHFLYQFHKSHPDEDILISCEHVSVADFTYYRDNLTPICCSSAPLLAHKMLKGKGAVCSSPTRLKIGENTEILSDLKAGRWALIDLSVRSEINSRNFFTAKQLKLNRLIYDTAESYGYYEVILREAEHTKKLFVRKDILNTQLY